MLFSLSAQFHGLNGACLALDAFGVLVPGSLRLGLPFWTPVVVGSAALLVAILTMGGVRGEQADPTDNDYARLMHELMGAELERGD